MADRLDLKILPIAAVAAFSLSCSPAVTRRPGCGLADLPVLKDFMAARFSSADPTGGNADGRHDWPIQPGETRTLADIRGPGAITHLWITIASPDKHHLKNLVLRMYWDGEDHPSVETPIGDFFGLGHGLYYQYWSAPIQIGVDKGLNCYWRMPFDTGARVTVSNEGPLPVTAFYYYVDYEKRDAPSSGAGRFHAQYRQAFPCPEGRHYIILDARGRGHYAGCNLSIHNRAGGWWGEGDDRITVDGEPTPSLVGTGSEDYFCGAWCYGESFIQPFSGPYFGNPLNDRGHVQNALWNVYRYHIEDPVPFTRSIEVAIEHGHANNRSDDFSSVAYWYQTEPHVPFPPLPDPADRLHTEATVFVEPYADEAETLAPAFQSSEVAVQPMRDFGNFWSKGSQLSVQASGPGSYRAAVPTYASDAGTYRLHWWVTAGPDYGTCELWFNQAKVCEWDGYHAGGVVRRKIEKTDPITVLPSGNVLEIRITGKNDASSGFRAGLDCYRVVY
jgi:hypothetical protein